MNNQRDVLLLVLPVPFRRGADGELLIEKQACNGIDRWADNFPRVILAAAIDETPHPETASAQYLPAGTLSSGARAELVPLAARPGTAGFLAALPRVRRQLRALIGRSDYLCFAIGGLVGDWAAVAAVEAIRMGREYAVWTDRVEHQVVRSSYRDATGLRRAFRFVRDRALFSPLMARLERHVVAHAALGLFHGRDCFEAYAPLCRAPHVVHNIHLKPADGIPAADLAAKLERIERGKPLRLAYAGRVAAMKGPADWLVVMRELARRGVAFEATWYGDGPLLEEMRAAAAESGLAAQVSFAGFVGERAQMLAALRAADLFVFCHKTPESPRCLIEALMSASPIVGYDSPYPADLVEDMAPRLLTAPHDPAQLAARIASLADDRAQLAELVRRSRDIGGHYSDEAVFRHRSELIKQHLPAPATLDSAGAPSNGRASGSGA